MRDSRITGVLLIILLAVALVETARAQCFTVLVGRKASASGAVLLAHNEDDQGPQSVNLLKVPHLHHKAGESVVLLNGGSVPQIPETAGFIWLEMPGQRFADSFLNEYGVTLVSNQCLSRVQEKDLSQGGISLRLRQLVVERAHSAREAVEIAGQLIETFGYDSSGRSYSIADTREVWMLSVVRGRIWVAARIPDDQVAVIPNHYTIHAVDLSDPAHFLGNPKLVEYAQQHGFYNAARDGAFDFSRAFGAIGIRNEVANLARRWRAHSLLSGKTLQPGRETPFTFKPQHPVSVQQLESLLRDHFEGTQFELPRSYNHGNPHHTVIKRICSDSTQYSLVADLNSSRPVELGAVLWFAPRRPCIQPFVPIFAGVRAFPPAFSTETWREALDSPMSDRTHAPPHRTASLAFERRAEKVDQDYAHRIGHEKKRRDRFEKAMFREFKPLEILIAKMWARNNVEARKQLTAFSDKWLKRLLSFNEGVHPSSHPSK